MSHFPTGVNGKMSNLNLIRFVCKARFFNCFVIEGTFLLKSVVLFLMEFLFK